MIDMEENERLDYLIKVLCGNNARSFAEKAGIRPDSLSRARNGKGRPSYFFGRILEAFPQVDRDWLYTGAGEPMKETKEKGEILTRIESLEKSVAKITKLLDKLIKYQQSANCK